MPVKRRAPKLRAAPAEVSDVAWALLTDQPVPGPGEPGDVETFMWRDIGYAHVDAQEITLERLWRDNADLILAQWVRAHPGTRPAAWWRWSGPDARPGETLGEPEFPTPERQLAYLRRHRLLLPGEAVDASAPRAEVDAA